MTKNFRVEYPMICHFSLSCCLYVMEDDDLSVLDLPPTETMVCDDRGQSL